MYREGVWGTVCSGAWTFHNGMVACRQLGYGDVLRSYHVHTGSGPIFSINCNGSESSLLNCSVHREYYCSHSDDVWITCCKSITN